MATTDPSARRSDGEETRPVGTLFLSLLFLFIILGTWGAVLLLLIQRG
ncbi:hypothetical protein [Thermorudis peleae]|nr:hypothetical protein [Thermorudis peleae]MBX6752965.1 hypothetical protein [Thermorudis peleae]